jgi:asparagine synthetase B (glutamine-hydrolysing)
VLTGLYGDTLYRRSEVWLADLLRAGKVRRFFAEVQYLKKGLGFRKVFSRGIAYRTMRELVLQIPGIQKLRKSPKPQSWLTDYAGKYLKLMKNTYSAERIAGFFSDRNADAIAREQYFTSRHQIEIRNPYRDRRILEFFLNLPAYQCFSLGETKWILRQAMADLLPEPVLHRKGHSNLLSLYNYGVNQKYPEMSESLDSGISKKFVRKDFVRDMLSTEITPVNDGGHTTIPALYLFFDIWYKIALKRSQTYGK